MYQEHPEFKIIRTANLPLWRYMDFWKFLSLINTSKLYFPNIVGLGDQHEGRIPEKVYKMMIEHEEKNNIINNSAQNYKSLIEKKREKIVVSSWCAADNENFAMWKMYAKEKLGVAIKSNFESLKKSFEKTNEIIFIGEVTYYNDSEPLYKTGNIFNSFLYKHNYYHFENEVRCLGTVKEKEKYTFKNIEIDLNHMIIELYISKFAESIGLLEMIEQIKVDKNLNFEIKISGVDDVWI